MTVTEILSIFMSSTFLLRKCNLVKRDTRGGFTYKAYRTREPFQTYILESSRGVALAALEVRSTDHTVKTVSSRRPGGFQTVFSEAPQGVDSVGLEMEIHNLTRGTLKLDLQHTPEQVRATDPGGEYSVNQVNELHKDQSHVVRVDQRNSRRMRIATKTKTDGSEITVKEAAKEADGDKNLKFYVHVHCPTHNPAHKDFTSEYPPQWKTQDHLVVYDKEVQYRGRGGGQLQSMSVGSSSRGGGMTFGSSSRGGYRDDGVQLQSASFGSSSRGRGPAVEEGVTKSRKRGREVEAVEEVKLDDAKAARLTYGDYEKVVSGRTGVTYDYDHPAEVAPIWLSFSSTIVNTVREQADVSEDVAIKFLTDMLREETLKERPPVIYKTVDACVIDLESDPDAIAFRCGHQCCSMKNTGPLKVCPMCRENVLTWVLATDLQ